jgi:hypothetical protein
MKAFLILFSLLRNKKYKINLSLLFTFILFICFINRWSLWLRVVVLLLGRACPTGFGKTKATCLNVMSTNAGLSSLDLECPSSCIARKHRQIVLFIGVQMPSLSLPKLSMD